MREPNQQIFFLSRKEAAKYPRISLATLVRRLDDGSIPYIKLGKRILIPVEALERLATSMFTMPGGK